MLRNLGTFEKAVLVSNHHAPFHITIVARLKNPPSTQEITTAFKELQNRHPLLTAKIIKIKKQFWFTKSEILTIPLQAITRDGNSHWIKIVEEELAIPFEFSQAPLYRVKYLIGQENADLIITLHHAIADAVGSSNLLGEVLQLSTGGPFDSSPRSIIPNPDDILPKRYQGLSKVLKLISYSSSMLKDEIGFQYHNIGKRKPPLILGGRGRIVIRQLPQDKFNTLAYHGRRKNLTLNSILNAAQLLALNRHLYLGKPTTMYTFTFANLRPFTIPSISSTDLGSLIAMMRYPILVHGSTNLWNLAENLQIKMSESFRSGEKFLSYLASEMMLRMLTKLKIMRFGASAFNYSSGLNITDHYGRTELVGLHGFVSAYDLGPELSSQAKIFNDHLVWDFTFLETDFLMEQAEQIIDEIFIILEDAVKEANP